MSCEQIEYRKAEVQAVSDNELLLFLRVCPTEEQLLDVHVLFFGFR